MTGYMILLAIALTGPRSRASKRSSRSKAASCNNSTSPEQPPAELSRDCSPAQKVADFGL